VLLPRIDDPRYDDIRRVAFAAFAALGMDTGLSHMEWFRRRDGGVLVSEVGARPPGAQITSLISWAHDVDFYRAWARLVVFEQFDPPERRYAAGCAYLRGQGRGRIGGARCAGCWPISDRSVEQRAPAISQTVDQLRRRRLRSCATPTPRWPSARCRIV
jgi:hypothetical protein